MKMAKLEDPTATDVGLTDETMGTGEVSLKITMLDTGFG
jgi:hypothetical protein